MDGENGPDFPHYFFDVKNTRSWYFKDPSQVNEVPVAMNDLAAVRAHMQVNRRLYGFSSEKDTDAKNPESLMERMLSVCSSAAKNLSVDKFVEASQNMHVDLKNLNRDFASGNLKSSIALWDQMCEAGLIDRTEYGYTEGGDFPDTERTRELDSELDMLEEVY